MLQRGALQMRGNDLVYSVCTVDSNATIIAGWRLGGCNLGLNHGFDHVDYDTWTPSVCTLLLDGATVLERLSMSE